MGLFIGGIFAILLLLTTKSRVSTKEKAYMYKLPSLL